MHIRPSDDVLQEPFWQGLAAGKLLIQRCTACGTWRHPPSPICARCRSFDAEWVPASGCATLYSFTVVHRAVHAAVEPWVPYVVAVVELVEGVRLVSRLVEVMPAAVRIGMALRCVIEPISAGFALPLFRPETDAPARASGSVPTGDRP
jgi:uncharacterized protein